MSWKKSFAAGIMSMVCLSLLIRPGAAAGIRSFTDRQGVLHVTNLGETDQDKGPSETQPLPRPTLLVPENKLDKMRILGILGPDETPAETPPPPEPEAKPTPPDQENR